MAPDRARVAYAISYFSIIAIKGESGVNGRTSIAEAIVRPAHSRLIDAIAQEQDGEKSARIRMTTRLVYHMAGEVANQGRGLLLNGKSE
ncbi:MAG: hypothetical protein A4E19_08080 [Nitrospira sp. SG-bin1]|nr:MAG: hypothetical protein A4E19_08080 [Nitrospira sp. SG-bin1]